MFSAVERTVARAARKTVLCASAALSFAVGLAFLTAAAWIVIAVSVNVFVAAMVIGTFYIGVGFVLLGLASARDRDTIDPPHAPADAPPQSAPPSNLPPLAQAFIFGIEAGAAAKRRRPRR